MSKGRPKKEPILPDLVDDSNNKQQIKGRLYPKEKELLIKKLEKRGYSSVADWIESEAEKVILDRDIEERKEEIEREIENKQRDLEELREELENLNKQVESREDRLEEVLDEIERDLTKLHKKHKGQIPRPDHSKFVRRAPDKYGIRWVKEEEANLVLGQEVSKDLESKREGQKFANAVLDRWKEEELIDLKRGD